MLDMASWEALCDSRGWTRRVALPRPERREVVERLRQEGMSTRAIAAAVGASKSTVSDDLAQLSDSGQLPESVTSLDGRTRPATRPEPVEVLTSEEWEARQGYRTTDELAQRRRTDAEREALRAKSKIHDVSGDEAAS